MSGSIEPEDRWARSPGGGRFARPERERRYLLEAAPTGLAGGCLIVDLYLVGTRLRLRQMSWDGGAAYKLTQKVRPDPGDPGATMITTVYLDQDEYELLSALPAHRLEKSRFVVPAGPKEMAIDVFHGALEGLVLAELELSEDEGVAPPPPEFAVADITSDERYAGGSLAGAMPEDVPTLLPRSLA